MAVSLETQDIRMFRESQRVLVPLSSPDPMAWSKGSAKLSQHSPFSAKACHCGSCTAGRSSTVRKKHSPPLGQSADWNFQSDFSNGSQKFVRNVCDGKLSTTQFLLSSARVLFSQITRFPHMGAMEPGLPCKRSKRRTLLHTFAKWFATWDCLQHDCVWPYPDRMVCRSPRWKG